MDTDIFKGFPTHIENTGGLLKISVQKDHKLGLFVESYLHENLKDLKSSRFIPKREDLHPGAIGIGQFDDQQYYRVQILDAPPPNNIVNVLFMDYGNTAKLPLTDIRLLNYEVHKALLNIPPLAITCYLEGVLVSKPWNDDELNTLKKLVLYEEKQCVVRHLHPRVKVVNIYFLHANKKLTELILENDLGSPISDVELLDAVKRMKSNRLSSDERVMAHQYPHRLSTLSDTYQERMLPTRELTAFNFSSAHLLPVGSSHNAYISHMTDGPYSFSIQLKSTAEDALPRLTRLLNQHDPIVNTKPLLPGTMVMTRLQNENFRRSIVMDVKSNMCQVYHTDYGSTDEVPFSEIYELPSQAHHAPSMALRFCLADIKSTQVTDASKAQFQELLEGKQVLIRVVKQESEGPLLQYCEMFYEGRNVKDILVAFNAPLEYTIQQPPRGKDLKVTVSHIESPSMFYIQYNTKLDILNNIQDAVNSYCKRQICLKDLSGLNIGSPVAALFEDNVWYRAMILSLSTDSAQVSYVDYGNRCDVFVSQLCQISRDLVTKWRTQAVECCLKGFENENINEADEMVIARMEETLNHTYNMTPLQILSTNRLLVELVDELGNRMSDIIRQVKAPKQKPSDVQVPPPQSQKPLSPEPTTDFDSFSHNSSNNKNHYDHWKNHGKSSKDKPRWEGNQKGGKSKQKADNMFIRPSIRPILEQQNKTVEQTDERPQKKSYIEHDDRFDAATNYNRESSFEKPRFSKNQDNRRNKDSFDNKKSADSWGESGNQDLNASFGSNTSQTGGFARSTPNNDGWNADRSKSKFSDRSKFGNRNESHGPRDDKSEDNWSEGSSGRPKRDGGRFNDRNRNDAENEGFGGGRFGGGGRRDDGEAGGRFGGGRRDGEASGRFGGGKRYESEGEGRFGGGRRDDREGGGRFGGGRRDDGEGGGRFGGGRRDDGEGGGRFGGGRRDDGEGGGRFGGGRRDDGEGGGRFGGGKRDDGEGGGWVGGGRRDDGESGGRFGGGRRDDGESAGRFGGGRRDNGEGGGRFGGRRGDQGERGGGRFGGGGQRDGGGGFGGGERRRDENGDRKGGGRFAKDDFRNKRLDSGFDTTPSGGDFGGANEEWGPAETIVSSTPEVSKVVSGSYCYPTISPNSSLQVILSCITHPHQIYVQQVGCEPDLDFLRSSIDNLGMNIKPFNENSLAPGVPLLARFSEDQALYRGIVKNVLQLNKANILFIDYGNSEDVPLNELYYIPAEILSKPPLAYNCRIFDIEPLNGQWPEDATVFDVYMNDQEAYTLKVETVKLVDGEIIINGTILNSAGESVSQKLVDGGLAVSTSDNTGAVEVNNYNQPLPEQTVESVSPVTTIQVTDKWIDRLDLLKNQIMYGEILESVDARTFIISIIDAKVITLATLSDHQADSCIIPGQAIIAEIVDILQDRLKITLFDLDGLEKEPFVDNTREVRSVSPICKFPVVRRTDEVYVPHAENNTLFIQRAADSDRLAVFLDEIYNFYHDTLPEERVWVANTLCAAMSVADGNWYRAEIISSEEKYKVRYLDYGNNEVLPPENLRTLNPQFFFSEMVLAVSLPVNFKSAESPSLETAIGQEFSCRISQGPNGRWFVDLFDISGKRFSDALLENNEAEALLDNPFLEINSEIGSSLTKGNKVPIVVSHADSPTMFWVQQQCHIDIVDTLQEKLQAVVVDAVNATDSDIVFAAKFTADDVWYRATKVSEGMLRFIDYGNTDSLIESKKLPEELCKPHSGYALPMYLCAQPLDGDWSADAIKEFEIFIERPNIVAEIVNVDYKAVVDLLDGGTSLAKILIDAGYAKRCDYIPDNVKKYLSIDVFDSFTKRIFATNKSEQPLPEPADNSELPQAQPTDKFEVPQVQPTQPPQVDPTVNSEVPQTELTNNSKPSTEEKLVYISHVNSLSDFYVQEDSVTIDIDEVSTSLSELECEESVTDVQVGGLYAAYYEFDDSWYRAKIISNCPEVHALFYDFGYSAIVNEIRNLPDDLLTKSPLAIHCSLGVEGTVSAARKLKMMSNEGLEEFTMRIKSDGNPTIVELLDTNGTNVLFLLDISPTAEDEKTVPIRQKVVITHSYGPDSFYAQTCELLAKSENVAIRMIDTENFDKLDEIAIGDVIAALYPEDCCWYRGQVLSSAPDIVVRFIDYGNTSVITDHRKLPPELKAIEPLTIKCSLQLPEGYDAWPDLSAEAFNTICNNNPGNLEIEFLSQSPLNIVELYLNNEPITENLLNNLDSYVNNSIQCLPNEDAAKGYITHINSVSDFYIQRKDCADLLTQVQAGLSVLEENPNEKPDCGVGSFIAARFIDGEWYRGQIVQIDPEIRVRFIDYGNECNVSEISALTDGLMQIPPVAVKCSLELEGVELKEDANCLFEKLCGDAETQFDFTVKSVQGNLSVVEIILNGENVLNELIVKTEVCKETSLKENEIKTVEDQAKEETKPVEQLEKDIKGHVIHINSITDFYIHNQNSREYLDIIEATLAETESFQMPSSVEVNDLICAKFEADQIWYRAKVIKTEPTLYVQFIDYGNKSEVFETRNLPPEILHIPALALRCTLKENVANEEAFFLLCGDPQTLFDFKIVSCSDGINTIEIWLEGEDISQKLSSFQLENGQNEECSVKKNDIIDSTQAVTQEQVIEEFNEKQNVNEVENITNKTNELNGTDSSEVVKNLDKKESDEKIIGNSEIVENNKVSEEVAIQDDPSDQLNDGKNDKIISSDSITTEDSKDEQISEKVEDKPINISQKDKSSSVKTPTAKSPKKVTTPTNVKTVAEIKANAKSKIVTRSSASPQKKIEKLHQPLSVRTSFDDTPVPGSISNPSSPVPSGSTTPTSPMTLRKQIHEEKIVPGQISSGATLETQEGDTVEN